MKKIFVMLLLAISVASQSQVTQTIYSTVQHGDTVFQIKTVNTGTVDSVTRYNYTSSNSGGGFVKDSTPYKYYFFNVTSSTKDSVQISKLTTSQLNNTAGFINTTALTPYTPGSRLIDSLNALRNWMATQYQPAGSYLVAADIAGKLNKTDSGTALSSYYATSGRLIKVRDSVQANIPTNTNQLTNGAGFITGNQTITLSGDVSGTGTTAITTTIGASKVTNSMLAGSIDYSKMDNATVPTWNQSTTGSAATLTTARKINGSSFDGSADIQTKDNILAVQAGGSPWLTQTLDFPLPICNTSTALVDNTVRFVPVWLPKAATVTGIRVYVRTQGSYTGDNNNKVGLYSYSGGTMTLVASSTNSSSLWTSAANAFQTIAFSSTYSASAGLYFVGLLYNNSAQTTAPTLAGGTAFNNVAMVTYQGTNSIKYFGTLGSSNDLPSSQAMSGVTGVTASYWVALY